LACRERPHKLVPRGGIEPPTRGFSVPKTPSETLRFPLGTSVKHSARPVKPGTPKHGHARSLSCGSIVFSPDVLLVGRTLRLLRCDSAACRVNFAR